MNILLSIHHTMNKNAGAPGVTYQLSQEYEQLGHQVMLYSYDDLPDYVPKKLKSIFFPYFLYRRIKSLSSQGKLDIVDASSGDGWIWCLLRNTQNGPVLVTRSHGLEHTMHESLVEEQSLGNVKLSWKYPIYHGGIRLKEVAVSFRKSDGSLFLNSQDYDYAIQNLKVNRDTSRIVKNGIPSYFLNLPFHSSSSYPEERIKIAQVGSYILRKGVTYTAQAMNVILSKHSNVELSFFGTGCTRETVLKDYDPIVHHQIHVISDYDHEQLPSLLLGHHIKLFPTLSEGFPLSLIEAMACGLAPITSFTSGSFIEDGYDSLFIAPRDPIAIVEKLEHLLTNPELLLKLRKNAYDTAQQHEWKHIAEEAIQFYEELRVVHR